VPYSILDTRLREYKLWIADFGLEKLRYFAMMGDGCGCEARGDYVGC
jgi:hypothetical protein